MFRTTFASLALTATLPAATQIFQSFEGDGFHDWKVEGSGFGMAPVVAKTEAMDAPFTAYSNDSLAASNHGGDAAKGTLTSPEFTVKEPYITFLLAGGDQAGKTAAQLVVDGKVVLEAVGKCSLRLETVVWDVAAYQGQQAVIRLIDDAEGPWGMIAMDHILFTDYPNQKFPATTRAGKPFVAGLVESAAVAGVSIPLDTSLTVAATYQDQQLTSPTALTFDEQGRIYIAETHRFREGIEDDRDHLYWYLDDLAAKTTADRRALHQKWKDKVPLERLTKKSELIRRLADTDGDGKIDEMKVFAEGYNDVLDGTAAGVFYYEGSLYFACIPKIQMLRDGDGDGSADERTVVAEGFGVRVSLSGHDLNGFTLGPDGRIYGTVGDRGFSLITHEGISHDYPNEGAVFRFEPDGSGFELFHTGLRNPKEIAFDALGNPFTVDNNSDQGDAARVVYLVEGGDSGWQMEHQAMHTFHRQIGLKDHPPSRWMDEKMWELQNPAQPAYILPPSAHLTAGPSGLTYHPGAGFLESEANRFLICDYRGGSANSGIWSFAMKPKGAGMEMSDSRQLMWGVAATDVEYSWDGKLFITDFKGGWTSHQDGRLLVLDAGEKNWQANEVAGAARVMKQGFEHRGSAELANLLRHPDFRIRLRAQLALTRKPDALERFSEATGSSVASVRIHGIWGLGIVARRGSSPLPQSSFGAIPTEKNYADAEKKLVAMLKDPDAEIRAQALRMLADAKITSNTAPLAELLADESPRVRYFAAMVAGKQRMIGHYSSICDLLQENNNRDVFLRHAGIFALQQMAENPAILTALVTHDSAAVRLAATVALRRMKNPGVRNFIHDPDPMVADEAIRAVCDLDLVDQRPAVAEWLDDLSSRAWSPFMLRRLLHNSHRLGTAADATRITRVAADASMPEIVREEAFRLLASWAKPFPVDQLTGHWRPLEQREQTTVRPALTTALPQLLQQSGFALSATLGLIKQYELSSPQLDQKALLGMAKNPKLPAEARSAALDLLVLRQPKNLDALLAELAADPSDEVALTALATIAKASPAAAFPLLKTATQSPSIPRAQKAWPLLAGIAGEAVDSLFVEALNQLRESHGISPTALELTTAAKSRSSAAVKSALEEFQASLAGSSDPLAKWNGALEGGDPAAGAALFASHPASECRRCHRAEEGHAAGGETAPNLFGIAKRHHDRRYFLQSMILPSEVITPGFGSVLVEFKNGASLAGNLLGETAEHLDLDVTGKSLRVMRADTQAVTAPTSPMPPMGELLNPGELRDVIAWLATLTEGAEEAPVREEPELLDSASLLTAAAAEASPAAEKVALDPAVMKTGKQQFIVCGACHGQNGEGTGAGPPLAGSEWVTGPEENLIRIQLRGLQGPIKVKGKEYQMSGGMAAMAHQTDAQIAAVLTYVRNSFGNTAPAVTAAAVAAHRSEVGKPQLMASELLPPDAIASSAASPAEAAADSSAQTYDELAPSGGIGKWILAGAAVLLVAALTRVLRP